MNGVRFVYSDFVVTCGFNNTDLILKLEVAR